MSYCRFIESDVYMYFHVDGFIQCCGCSFDPKLEHPFPEFFKYSDAIIHLEKHAAKGDKVLDRAMNQLKGEMEENGDKDFRLKRRHFGEQKA